MNVTRNDIQRYKWREFFFHHPDHSTELIMNQPDPGPDPTNRIIGLSAMPNGKSRQKPLYIEPSPSLRCHHLVYICITTYSRFILLDYSFYSFYLNGERYHRLEENGRRRDSRRDLPLSSLRYENKNSNVNPSLFVSCFERIEGEKSFQPDTYNNGKHFLRSYNLTLETF